MWFDVNEVEMHQPPLGSTDRSGKISMAACLSDMLKEYGHRPLLMIYVLPRLDPLFLFEPW
jgi:hypothetical protein